MLIYTPDEGEDFEKTKAKAIKRKLDFDIFQSNYNSFAGKSLFVEHMELPKSDPDEDMGEEKSGVAVSVPELDLGQLPEDLKNSIKLV